MEKNIKIAFWCYLAALIGLAVSGGIYLFRSSFMPYHSVAVGLPWAEVPAPFQLLILALMKVIGAAWLVIVLAAVSLLLGPFRRGAAWARRVLPILLIGTYAGMANAMYRVTVHSPAWPPWSYVFASLALVIVAVIMTVLPDPGEKRK
ncbi:MAG: hypothetical protein ACLFPD_02875 [Desulfosudaceae bacterium]